MASPEPWTLIDAWVLCSVPRYFKSDVSKVVARTNLAGEDVFNREEVEQSLSRLASAGLVTSGERLSLTREGRSVTRLGKGRGRDRADSIQRVLSEATSQRAMGD